MISHLALAMLGSITVTYRPQTIQVVKNSPCSVGEQKVRVVDEGGKPIANAVCSGDQGVLAKANARGWIHVPYSSYNCNPVLTAPGRERVKLELEPARKPGSTVGLRRANLVKFHITQDGGECLRPLVTDHDGHRDPHRPDTELILPLGANEVRTDCNRTRPDPLPITQVNVKPVEGQVVEISMHDPTMDDPANHLELRGKVQGTLPEHERARLTCGRMFREVIVAADGTFVLSHLHEWPRCKVELWHGENVIDHVVRVSLPSGPVEIDLGR